VGCLGQGARGSHARVSCIDHWTAGRAARLASVTHLGHIRCCAAFRRARPFLCQRVQQRARAMLERGNWRRGSHLVSGEGRGPLLWRGTRASPLPLCSWTGRHHFHLDLICDCNANRFGTLCWKGVAAAVLSCATLCVVHGDHVDAPRERSSRLRELPGGSSLREFRGCLCHAWGPGVMPRAPT